MKRLFLMLTVISLLVFGCGKKEDVNTQTVPKEPNSAAQETNESKEDTVKPEKDEKEPFGSEAVTLTENELRGEIIDGEYHVTAYLSDAKNVIVPDHIKDAPVTVIGEYVFGGSPIESIVFPDTVKIIGRSQFNSCSELTSVTFGAGLKEIGKLCFVECPGLEEIVFPEGLEKIDGCCFSSCSNLKEIYVPSSVNDFGEGKPLLLKTTCPNAVILTPSGSPAEAVCKENDIPVRNE